MIGARRKARPKEAGALGRTRRAVGALGLLLASPSWVACSTERPAEAPARGARGEAVHFRYELADGTGAVSSEALRGHVAVVVFVATYDLASQAEVRFLSGIIRRRAPRVLGAAVALEPEQNRPLVIAFRDALALPFPVALGDAALVAGDGPFGDVSVVPSTVVLDGDGRLVWRRAGLCDEEAIEAVLRTL